jgi:hypothetical protein
VEGTKGFALDASASAKAPDSKFSLPGLYPGRVCAVENQASIISGQYQAEQVQKMMRRGMMELTGADGWVDAWRQFFEPGDVVGIKVNPVGQPNVISDATVMHEIIAGLEAAGVKRQDIVAYDRYRRMFYSGGFDKWLPDGVRISWATDYVDNVQQNIEGYDPDCYMDMALTLPGYSVDNATARRSYAAQFITKQVNKVVNLPVLKDHQSAGVTGCLKNLSHGLVNNVNRSHATPSLNACNTFIPAVVALPVIRSKVVLNIFDGIKGLYNGGPAAEKPDFVWEHKTLYFSTDPVAMDHIAWEVIDAKREAMGMKKLVESLPDKISTFVHRQPEHVEIAGALGLGVWDRNKIDLRKVNI